MHSLTHTHILLVTLSLLFAAQGLSRTDRTARNRPRRHNHTFSVLPNSSSEHQCSAESFDRPSFQMCLASGRTLALRGLPRCVDELGGRANCRPLAANPPSSPAPPRDNRCAPLGFAVGEPNLCGCRPLWGCARPNVERLLSSLGDKCQPARGARERRMSGARAAISSA